jgi:N-acetylmuramoyl-L-alanine amidase
MRGVGASARMKFTSLKTRFSHLGSVAARLLFCGCLIASAGIATRVAASGIAVDVGHSLAAPGAFSARGIPEHVFNRALAMDIVSALAKVEATSFLIGERGEMERLMDRVVAARDAQLLLSVHHDSVQEHFLQAWQVDGVERRYSDRYSGFSLFVSRRNPSLAASLRCASAIGAELRRAGFTPSLYHADRIRGESKPFADRTNGVHYYDNLVVLRHARGPALLFEAGVIVNRDEELALASDERRRRMAEAVATGAAECTRNRR